MQDARSSALRGFSRFPLPAAQALAAVRCGDDPDFFWSGLAAALGSALTLRYLRLLLFKTGLRRAGLGLEQKETKRTKEILRVVYPLAHRPPGIRKDYSCAGANFPE